MKLKHLFVLRSNDVADMTIFVCAYFLTVVLMLKRFTVKKKEKETDLNGHTFWTVFLTLTFRPISLLR